MSVTVKKARESVSRARLWLRRVMPRVAVAAGVSFVLRALVQDFFPAWHDSSFFGSVLDFVTTLLVVPTLVYYGYKTLRWLKQKLLWRVRRRLIITYLFVGLTPIVLLAGLGFLFGYSMALNSMADTVMKEVGATERETLANARGLADALDDLPTGTNGERLQAWLDERNRLLQASLPGARIVVWRGADNTRAETLDLSRPALFVSEPEGEWVRAVGDSQLPLGAPLPEWLREREEWSGLSIIPSSDPRARYGSPSLRALARRESDGRALALLLIVPVSRALVEQVRESTGIRVRPAFSNRSLFAPGPARKTNVKITSSSERRKPVVTIEETSNEGREVNRNIDQLGEERTDESHAIVVMPVTNWLDGERERYITFMFPSSVAAARGYALERGYLGQEFRLNNVLLVFVVIFAVFELLALLAAGWITRAVTGTVHKLYQATEFIKRGDFSHRVKVRSHDQLGELSIAFNEMSANVETLLQERVKHERLEREVEIAHEVQTHLFPREVPRLESAEIVGECRAARGVAGDYYDYAEIVPGLIAFALGDVAGKGISASLVMSNLQAALRAQVTILAERWKLAESALTVAAAATAVAPTVEPMLEQSLDLPCGVTGVDTACAVENMVASINEQLCRSTDSNRFATFFLALYDDRTRRLRYTNAGHNDPLLVRADGSVEKLNAGGTVLGAFEWVRYEEAATTLAPGDLLLVFSDGFSEAQNTVGEEYGEARLAQFAAARRHKTADEIRRAVFEEIDNWSGGQERGDDQTVVILKAR